MFNIAVFAPAAVIAGKENLAKIFRRMRHSAIIDRFCNDIVDFIRQRTKNRRARYDYFLTHADQKVCIGLKKRVNHVEMLNDYTFAALNSVQNCIGKHSHLRECRLKAYVKMISVRSKKTLLVNVKNRKRASVHSVIIVCQLEPGEHAFYQHALARACLADNADKLIKRAEIHLRNMHSKIIYPVASSGCEKDAVIVAVLHSA